MERMRWWRRGPAEPAVPATAERVEPAGAEAVGESVGPVGLEPRAAGRPRAGAAERTQRVGVSLSAGEKQAWQQAAAAAGRGQVARWVREVVEAHLATDETGRAPDEVRAVRSELVRIGSNLNQVARVANTAALDQSQVSATEVLASIEACRAELGALREATVGS